MFDPNDKENCRLVERFEVEFENVFHFKNLYKMVHEEWMPKWGFESYGGRGEPETLYFDKTLDSGAKEYHIWWRMQRVENAYFKFFIKLDFQGLNMTTVEVMHEGKKVKTNRGDMIIRIEAWLLLDYQDEWAKHGILKRFKKKFQGFWHRKMVEQKRKDLIVVAYDLQNSIKQYFELQTPYDLTHNMWRPKGFMG